jgi:mannosyltransferase
VSTTNYPASGLGERRPSAVAGARTVGADIWILAALIVLAAVIRIVTIDNQSFWTDEALTAYEAGLPFGAMLHTVARVETTPPLYFVLIWVWAKLFGTGTVALRSLSAIAGVAIVPIAYASARELLSRRAGVLAAAFVVVNPFMIWYSQEARSYMLLAALTGASFLFFARARRDPSRRNLGWWAGLSAAAVMTHFFAGFAVAPEALWLLWQRRTRATTIAVGVVAAAQVAMLPFAFVDASASRGAGWIAAIPRLHRVAETVIEWGASNLYRRTTTPEGLVAGAALAIAVALLLILGGDRRTRRGAGVAAAIAAFVFVAPLALGLLGPDYFYSRNEIPAFVPVVTVLAAACAAPRARAAGAALAVVLLAVFFVTAIDVQTHPYLQRPDWRSVALALGPALAPGRSSPPTGPRPTRSRSTCRASAGCNPTRAWCWSQRSMLSAGPSGSSSPPRSRRPRGRRSARRGRRPSSASRRPARRCRAAFRRPAPGCSPGSKSTTGSWRGSRSIAPRLSASTA